MRSIKQINLENRPCYFFNDMINIKNFNWNLLNIDKISFKSINAVIYSIKYIIMKSLIHLNIDSENSPHLTFNNVDGYTEENNGDKYLAFASKGKNKKVLKKYTQLWDEIKNPIETINGGKPVEYNFFFS